MKENLVQPRPDICRRFFHNCFGYSPSRKVHGVLVHMSVCAREQYRKRAKLTGRCGTVVHLVRAQGAETIRGQTPQFLLTRFS
jgi:hypothetical protein